MSNRVLYKVASIDFNKDEKLNHDDPEFLFVSDNDGSNFKSISPLHEDLQYFEVISNTNEIILRTLRDTNNDLLFSRDDESIWYRVMLKDDEWKLEEMIDSSIRDEVGNLYFEHWLKKN